MEKPETEAKERREVSAKDIIARNNSMKAERGTWDATISEISNYVMPRKNQINVRGTTPDVAAGAELYNTTAVESNLVLGAGQLQYITPANERWAGFEPPESLRKSVKGAPYSRLAKWYQSASDVLMRELSRCNFYAEVHEFYLDRGGMGTACLSAMEGKKTALNIKTNSYGTYCIAEDDEGYVDTVFREFPMTCRQMVQKFGLDNVGPKVRECWVNEAAGKKDVKFTVIHAVYPREEDERDPERMDGKNKPIASVYVCYEDDMVLSDHGFDEMPMVVSRYLTWGAEVWGYSPAVDILGTIRQVNVIERAMDVLAEKAANPPMLVPESMDGVLDVRQGGVTSFDPNQPNAMPREWQTQGRYDVGLDRIKTKDEAIKRAFHADLFQMFAGVDRQITAYETMQRVAEKLVLFSPTFAKLTTEFLNPFLQRCFSILYRAGLFDEPPPEAFVQTGPDSFSLAIPQVTYTSKVALAIKALENQAFVEFMNIVGPLVQLRPEVLDNIDADQCFLDLMRNFSLKAEWQVDEEARDETRKARAEQQQAANALAAGEQMSKSAANLGKAPPGMGGQVAEMVTGGRN